MLRSRGLIGCLFALAGSVVQAADWPSLRGPRSDGSTTGGRISESASLELTWKHAIGAGYSGVTVAAGRAVSAFSDGTSDVVAAWSVADGRELWRTPIGPTYRGHDGSTDGPISTATVTDERVYFVGPRGNLLAMSAETGKILWSKSLESEWGARAPTYGFGATPLVVGEVLVVAVGAQDRSVVGLDPADGETVWSIAADGVAYSTPVVVRIGRADQVVVAGSTKIFGLDPRAGRLLWSHPHSDEPAFDPTYPQIQPLDGRLLLTFHDEAVLYDLEPGADGVTLSERWRSQALKKSVAIPVAVGDHLYGFNGTFLTCVSLETGETAWKSRTPRARGLILVDDSLVILGSGGILTIAKADPAGYRETASLVVSDHGGYTAPSFADGRIYVRNRTDVASVAVRASESEPPAQAAAPEPARGEFARWIRRIEQAEDPGAAVEEFLSAQTAFPIVEKDWVHFVYAGPAEAVAVLGQMKDENLGEPMRRVGGTDLFVRSYPAVPGGRWQYRFEVDFGEPQVDPRNPNRGSGGFVETSEVLLEGFTDPWFVTEAATVTGRLEAVKVTSEAYGQDVEVPVYLPAGYDSRKRYPLIVMPNGAQWTEAGGIVAVLDRLFESHPRSALVALVPMSGWAAGSWGGSAVRFLGDEVLPAIEAKYLIAEAPRKRSLWTVEDKAAVGLTLAIESPEKFGRFAFQSPKLYFGEWPDIASLSDTPTGFYVSWSRYEPRSAEDGNDDRAQAVQLAKRIREAGLPLHGGELVAGPGYRTWRTEAEAILEFLLGVE